ncbi:hypothetical protein Tco_0430368, partial [Tanacetum coccineum]
MFVSADSIKSFLLTSSIPADYVPAGSSSSIPARVLNSGAVARYSGAIARGVASTLRNRPRRHLEAWRAIRRHIARYSAI